MRSILTSLITAAFLTFGSTAAADQDKPHLLSIVTSASNDSQAMALILTRHHVQAGGSAQVLLCDTAAEMALQDSDTGSTVVQPADASPRDMLGALMQAGVSVDVCAIFLPNREVTEADLREGVGVARPDTIADIMGRPDTRLFTN